MIEESKRHITRITKWVIDESSFTVLNEEKGYWIANVTTTHLKTRGEKEETFTILVQGYGYFIIEPEILPALTKWCLQNWN
jgi:hypothetical protein